MKITYRAGSVRSKIIQYFEEQANGMMIRTPNLAKRIGKSVSSTSKQCSGLKKLGYLDLISRRYWKRKEEVKLE